MVNLRRIVWVGGVECKKEEKNVIKSEKLFRNLNFHSLSFTNDYEKVHRELKMNVKYFTGKHANIVENIQISLVR